MIAQNTRPASVVDNGDEGSSPVRIRKLEFELLVRRALKELPPEFRDTPEAHFLYEFGCVTRMDVARLVYRPQTPY